LNKYLVLIIATYQREKALSRILDALVVQTLPQSEWEIVVAVDGSTDGTLDLLAKEVERRRLPLRYFYQENAGQAAARDCAIRMCDAATVVIVDDDMEIPPGFLAAHYVLSKEMPEPTVVVGRVVPPDDWKARPLYEAVREDFMASLHRRLAVAGAVPTATAFVTQNVSFPRKLYLDVGGFDPLLRLDEDRELGMRFEHAGARFVFGTDAWAIHRSDIGSFSKWLRRQREYGRYAVQVWQKHGREAALHPCRNFVNGSVANSLIVRFCAGQIERTELLGKILRFLGEHLRGLSFVLGLATHKALIALEFHQGVSESLGGWKAFREAASHFRNDPQRPSGPTGSGPMTPKSLPKL
jgi:glycosyltransferase involved in cell wall biosynthesis